MRYEVVDVLGRGATAVVELAVAQDGTRIARKRLALAGSGAEIEAARRRLRREAGIAARLDHPAIVPVLAVEDDGADVVIVMPALAGSLADLGGGLDPGRLLDAARRLLAALAAAHGAGVVHRDIKPANVLLDHRGRVALADFGAATSREVTAGLTVAGTIIGTPRWLAPEQARGEVVGPAADVFSLGATLLWAASGWAPWGDGPTEAVVARAGRGAVTPVPSSLDPALRPVLSAMVVAEPARRPSAAALLERLDATRVMPSGGGWSGRRRGVRGHPPHRPVLRRPVPGATPTDPPGEGRRAPARTATGLGPERRAPTPATDRASRGLRAPAWDRARAPLADGGGPPTAASHDWTTGAGPTAGEGRSHARRGLDRGRAVVLGGDGSPLRHPRLVAATVAAAVAVAGTVVGVAVTTGGRTATPAHAAPTVAPPTPAACVARPFEPCGRPPAPHTDGTSCLPGWYDLDGNAADGCEAHSDWVSGTHLGTTGPVRANVVPPSSTDTFTTSASASVWSFCGGTLDIGLTAPAGVADTVRVLDGRTLVASATSVDGTEAIAEVPKPGCFGSYAETLTIEVQMVAGASASDFTLSRSGGW